MSISQKVENLGEVQQFLSPHIQFTQSLPPVPASVAISVCGKEFSALIDTGSSESFISEWVIKFLKLPTHPSSQNISMTLATLNTHVLGHYFIDLTLNDHVYNHI